MFHFFIFSTAFTFRGESDVPECMTCTCPSFLHQLTINLSPITRRPLPKSEFITTNSATIWISEMHCTQQRDNGTPLYQHTNKAGYLEFQKSLTSQCIARSQALIGHQHQRNGFGHYLITACGEKVASVAR